MTTHAFDLNIVDSSWLHCLQRSLEKIDISYLQQLSQDSSWLPGPAKIFSAFSLPLNQVNYVLFGESPYPRKESANGYAFWDAAVHDLWSDTGLSKPVNRATSLRNILKMLLIAEGLLSKKDCSQEAIARINKQSLIKTSDELFQNFIRHGFLLLNATPVLADSPQKDARAFHPFMRELLECLLEKRPQIRLILLGRIANTIDTLIPASHAHRLYAEHPYNLSFITNQEIIDFFKPLHLLRL
jgi:uracil-DNA glycosylase